MIINSKEYLTNLLSAGVSWYQQYIKYHCPYDTRITMVLSQYGTEGFVYIWYHHDTDSVNFQKTFDAPCTLWINDIF